MVFSTHLELEMELRSPGSMARDFIMLACFLLFTAFLSKASGLRDICFEFHVEDRSKKGTSTSAQPWQV